MSYIKIEKGRLILPIAKDNEFICDENTFGEIKRDGLFQENEKFKIYITYPVFLFQYIPKSFEERCKSKINYIEISWIEIYNYFRGKQNKIYTDIDLNNRCNQEIFEEAKKEKQYEKEHFDKFINTVYINKEKILQVFDKDKLFDDIEQRIYFVRYMFNIHQKVNNELIYSNIVNFREFVDWFIHYFINTICNSTDKLDFKNNFVDWINLLYCGLGYTLITKDKSSGMKRLFNEKQRIINKYRVINYVEFIEKIKDKY